MKTLITMSINGKSKKPTSTIEVLALIFIPAITGAVILAGFWGAWYAVAGKIPKFLGFSRFWLDTISAAVYAPVFYAYIGAVLDMCDELSDGGEYPVYIRTFVRACPWLTLLGIFLAIDFVASIFLTFAVGLAGIVALAITVATKVCLRAGLGNLAA